ncbi:restriction endonuclease subunit S [Polaribacter glomeratus]|uniref:Type I restriction modification DNA specificity domain-containing protein n=1 Tax=Polaribacter glomeratus TaxID=102 RepID=A0A2S7WYE1_9FLAO|nr:restriction endonuclease subunit S [Polaribacter glomeratus]PQJ82607.1 hypothetical protein BTO16_08470 [Polaribacter glomeratus]TXD64937.1 hypothetical protein ESX12_12395 [Polaribacter glomeratus]
MELIKGTEPRLRFPNFKENWKEYKLYELLVEHKIRNKDNEVVEVFSVAKVKGVVNQIEHLGRSYASDNISNYKVVNPYDVVYTKSPTANYPFGIIKQNRTNRTGVVSVLYGVFKPKNRYIGSLLHYYFSSSINIYNYLVPVVNIGAKNTMNVGNSDFLNGFKLSLPTNELEQKKVSIFFYDYENYIKLLNNKLALLIKYRNAVVEKIFSQEIRFKADSGSSFPVWREMKVSEIFEKYSNPVNVVLNEKYKEIGIRSHGKGIFHKESKTGDEIGNKRVFWLKEELFILNIVFAWEGAVAKTSKNEVGMIASHRFPTFKAKDSILNLDFILAFFKTRKGLHLLQLASPGGAGRNKTLGKADFDNLKILIPDIKEQNKIADFIIELDLNIKSLKKQIDKAKKYKNGLLQQMFCN